MKTLVLALVIAAAAALAPARAAAPATYGKGVTLATTTPLDRLLKDPAPFEGKTVRVEGVVTAVCTEMGCWMALGTKDAAGVPTMMIKVEDGVIVFPVSAKGKKAAAQGVVQRVGGGEASEAAREKALADPSAKKTADSWLIQATGAIVY
jgi:Domain of unknown function (DUF4920)